MTDLAVAPRSARPAATIAIATFVVLVLEITSSRLFAYIGSSHATSTALSVALLGLGIGAFMRLRLGDRIGQPALLLSIALLALALAAIIGISIPGLVAIALVPFAAAGMLVSDAYARRGSAAARSTYGIDLLSAAAGCLIAPRLVGPLSPIDIMLVLGVVASGLATLCRRSRAVVLAIVAMAHLGLLVASRAGALPDGPLEALLGSDRPSDKAIVDSSTSSADIVDSAWSPIGRLDVHRTAHDPSRLGVFTDGMSPTYLVEESHARAVSFEASWGLLMSLPYRALRPDRVLVLGAGAGASVWLATHYGATRVDAVEVNPEIPDVMARWRHFAGDVYDQPGVRLVIEDARRYLVDTDEHYDLIELALALTGNAHAQAAGLEAHLYTVEAVQLYLRRLSPTGALVLIHSDPGNAYRQLLTVLDALAEMGIPHARALEGIAVLRDPRPGTAYRYLLVVRTSPMAPQLADELDVQPAELLWGPGDPPERGEQLLDPAKLGATGRDDFSPVHDDRPYFFQNTRGVMATALAEPGRLWVLAGALVLVLALLIEHRRRARPFGGLDVAGLDPRHVAGVGRDLELARAGDREEHAVGDLDRRDVGDLEGRRGGGSERAERVVERDGGHIEPSAPATLLGDPRPFLRPALVATGLGAAYLCVELALIQRFTLAAGGTLYAVSFVLFGLLAWSALGSLLLAGRWQRHDRGVAFACVAAGLAAVVTAVAMRDLAWLDAISSDAGRVAIILVMLAPVGLTIGCPFPVLLSHHGEPDARIASLWAINGAASVAGGVIAVLALRVGGTTDALLLAAGLYAVTASIAARRAS